MTIVHQSTVFIVCFKTVQNNKNNSKQIENYSNSYPRLCNIRCPVTRKISNLGRDQILLDFWNEAFKESVNVSLQRLTLPIFKPKQVKIHKCSHNIATCHLGIAVQEQKFDRHIYSNIHVTSVNSFSLVSHINNYTYFLTLISSVTLTAYGLLPLAAKKAQFKS